MLKKLSLITAALILSVGLAACGSDDPAVESGEESSQSDAPADNRVSITQQDYAFQVSGPVKAGTVTIEVTNAGAELHEIAMAKLLDGKTMEDVKAALDSASPDGDFALKGVAEEDSRIDDLGGAQAPGTSYAITGTEIPAGEYALICFIPNAEGESHFKLGMLSSITVEEGDVTGGPEATQTYTATDEKLDGPTELPAGPTTLEFVNDSSANREIYGLKLKDGKTMEDAGKFFAEAESGNGPPDFANSPFDFFTFVFDGEMDRKLTLDLTPGTWAFGFQDPENQFEGPPTEDPHAKVITVT